MKKNIIKIYGQRNSGTNYLRELVSLNLKTKILPGVAPWLIQKLSPGSIELPTDLYFGITNHNNLGWKHCVVPKTYLENPSCQRLTILTITKNPYAWLLSMYRNPHHYNKKRGNSFLDFLTTPWKTTRRENHPGNFSNPIVMWSKKNRKYFQITEHLDCMNIKYEDLLHNPANIISKIAIKFSLEQKHQGFVNFRKSTKNSNKTYSYYQEYYLNQQWKEELNHETIKIINQYLDMKTMKRFGYEVLYPDK